MKNSNHKIKIIKVIKKLTFIFMISFFFSITFSFGNVRLPKLVLNYRKSTFHDFLHLFNEKNRLIKFNSQKQILSNQQSLNLTAYSTEALLNDLN